MAFETLKSQFIELFGGSEEGLRIFVSPGRVNMIGEHTDYNGGYVMPAALTMRTAIVARKREDNLVRLAATDLEGIVVIDLGKLEEYNEIPWGNYQAGVMSELRKDGETIIGCDLLYEDTVPHGGGLSSSAAIEVATALTFKTFSDESKGLAPAIDPIYLAKIGQRAENVYIGVNCGIMDQFASAMGKENHLIFLDCKDLSYRHAPLHMTGYKIVIANTNKKRSLAHSKYNERRAECETGLKELQTKIPEASCLGVISAESYEAAKGAITDPVVKKRVEHVIYEDHRVLKSIEALEKNDIIQFGQYMNQSHDSLRDLYEVTGIELDTLVEEARKIDGVIGSRMTGAGFGGCTVSIVKEEKVEEFIQKVGENYKNKVNLEASFYISEVGDGCREI